MTNPLLNLRAPLVIIRDNYGYLISPWNSFFQQNTIKAPAVAPVGSNPFTANANGTVIIKGAITVTLTRGLTNIDLTGQEIIPISISDTISWTGPVTSVQFLGA